MCSWSKMCIVKCITCHVHARTWLIMTYILFTFYLAYINVSQRRRRSSHVLLLGTGPQVFCFQLNWTALQNQTHLGD